MAALPAAVGAVASEPQLDVAVLASFHEQVLQLRLALGVGGRLGDWLLYWNRRRLRIGQRGPIVLGPSHRAVYCS